MIRGNQLQRVVDAGLAPSVKWLQNEIRHGRVRARKIGRHWVMTDADIEAFVESRLNKPAEPVVVTPFSLTATSLRRQGIAS